MKQETKQETKPKKKRTKRTIKRITALLLVFLLTISVSPVITAHADGSSTHEGSDGGEHGGISGSWGDDSDDGSQLVSPPSLVINDDGTRTLNLDQSVVLMYKGDVSSGQRVKSQVTGSGKFVVRSFDWNFNADSIVKVGVAGYIFSDKEFTIKNTITNLYNHSVRTGENISTFYNGVYVIALSSTSSYGYSLKDSDNFSFSFKGFANLKHISSDRYPTAEQLIDSGDLDFEKDDYMPEDQISKLEPVRDDSIGYLPRARYFDNRRKYTNASLSFSGVGVTSTIQWDSFVEPYSSDLDNYYYVEVYAKLHYTLAHRQGILQSWVNDASPSMRVCQFKKFGEIKYVNERLEFSYNEPLDAHLRTLNIYMDASGNIVNSDAETNIDRTSCYVSDYYVRLLHYDYDKQQLLCGGWTKLTIDDNGGCTSSEGDFGDNDPEDGDWNDDPDGDNDKNWNPSGDDITPTPPNPDDPDSDFDLGNIGDYILATVKSLFSALAYILSSVGQFPSLVGNVFSFLPEGIIYMMYGGFGMVILLRILGR